MIRRVTSAFVLTVAFLGAFLLPTAQPATAQPASAQPASAATYGCSIVVPPVVWVTAPHTLLPATLGPDCSATGATYASWNVRSSYGPSDVFIFDGRHSATNGLYDSDHYGTYYVEPRDSWNYFYDLTQNTATYVVKSGSTVAISASRVGRDLTLRVSTTHYSPAASSFQPWQSQKVLIQYKDKKCPTCAWMGRAIVTTDSNGTATFASNSPYLRYYRALTVSSPTVWGRTSVTLFG